MHKIIETTKKERKDSFERLKEKHPIEVSISPTRDPVKQQAMDIVEKNGSFKKAKIMEEKSKLQKEVEKMDEAKSKLLGKVVSASKKGKTFDFEFDAENEKSDVAEI